MGEETKELRKEDRERQWEKLMKGQGKEKSGRHGEIYSELESIVL